MSERPRSDVGDTKHEVMVDPVSVDNGKRLLRYDKIRRRWHPRWRHRDINSIFAFTASLIPVLVTASVQALTERRSKVET